MSRADDRVILYAGLFVLIALLAIPVQAATQRVEDLAFSRVLIFGSVDVEITQGESNELQLRGRKDELDYQSFLVDGDTLVLGRGPDDPGRNLSGVKYRLQLKSIEELGIKGDADVYVRELSLPRLELELDGSAEVKMFGFEGDFLSLLVRGSGDIQLAQLVAREFEASLSGSGDIKLGPMATDRATITVSGSGEFDSRESGSTGELILRLMGSGDVELKRVDMRAAEVAIMGSGDVELGEVEQLEATIFGSGSVYYRGNPQVSRNIVGSGDVERSR